MGDHHACFQRLPLMMRDLIKFQQIKIICLMINLSLLSAPYYYLHLTRATSTPQVSMLKVRSAWNNYTLATKLDKGEEPNQVTTLLAVIGKEANKVFRTSSFSSPEDAKKIESILRKF